MIARVAGVCSHVAATVVALALLASAAGCAAPGAGRTTVAGGATVHLDVYAAASLRRVLDALKADYERANPLIALSVSTDSSAALAAKIEQGAPADVFLSADTENPQGLVQRGFADGPVVPFARTQLSVIVPAANPARIATPADLARPGVKIIAAGASVPITAYTETLVRNLAMEPGVADDFATRYEANVVSREDNASAIVAKIALGEGDAGIVYATDARGSSAVRTVTVPPGANVTATYGAVVVRSSDAPGDAAALLDWLREPGGQAILASAGFGPAP